MTVQLEMMLDSLSGEMLRASGGPGREPPAARDHGEAVIVMGSNREGGQASSPSTRQKLPRSGASCQDRVSDFLTSSHEGLQGPETPLTVKSWSPPQPIDPLTRRREASVALVLRSGS